MLIIEGSSLGTDSPWPERIDVNLEEAVRLSGMCSTTNERFTRFEIKQDAEGEVTEVLYTATVTLRVLND